MTRIRSLRALPVVLFLLGGTNASAADATPLGDPKWPEIGLAVVAALWGVDAGPPPMNPVPPDFTRSTAPSMTP